MEETPVSFIILWTAFDKYEYIQDYKDSPHEYAWNSDKYGVSPYIIVEVKEPLKKFRMTPEDQLLERIFS